jgi:hypothetical protein
VRLNIAIPDGRRVGIIKGSEPQQKFVGRNAGVRVRRQEADFAPGSFFKAIINCLFRPNTVALSVVRRGDQSLVSASSAPIFFWHTICVTLGVAKKYHPQNFIKGPANGAVMNMRLAMYSAAGMGVPPRAKRVHIPRRRLPVVGFTEPVQAVKIIHAIQNLGSPVTGTQPAQSPRV